MNSALAQEEFGKGKMMTNTATLGKYQHFRNKKLYEVIGFAIHSETKEEMVIYKALYKSDEYDINQTWVRPKKMFFEEVEHEGELVPRFTRIDEYPVTPSNT